MAGGKQSEPRTVTAALVTAKRDNGTVFYMHRDDVLPDDISKESADHLAGLGYLSDDKK